MILVLNFTRPHAITYTNSNSNIHLHVSQSVSLDRIIKSHLNKVDKISSYGILLKYWEIRNVCFILWLYKDNFKVVFPPSFKLNRLTFLPSVKDVIGFMKSVYVDRIIDFTILHKKCFAVGEATRPAKVSCVHGRSRPGLPIFCVAKWYPMPCTLMQRTWVGHLHLKTIILQWN